MTTRRKTPEPILELATSPIHNTVVNTNGVGCSDGHDNDDAPNGVKSPISSYQASHPLPTPPMTSSDKKSLALLFLLYTLQVLNVQMSYPGNLTFWFWFVHQ
jgi:hypothetical protein